MELEFSQNQGKNNYNIVLEIVQQLIQNFELQ